MCETFKKHILDNVDILRYNNHGDDFSRNLINDIKHAKTFEDILCAYYFVSKAVNNSILSYDMMNSCEGDNSPLMLFCSMLLKQENLCYYQYMLCQIKSHSDYMIYDWIMMDVIYSMLSNPIQYKHHLSLFIEHPYVGSRFNFVVAKKQYYDTHNTDYHQLDEAFLFLIKKYSEYHGTNPNSKFRFQQSNIDPENTNFPFTIDDYKKEVIEDLTYAKLNFVLPKTFDYLMN